MSETTTNQSDKIFDCEQPTPLLDSIDTPAQLRKLSKKQLVQLCDELRRFIVKEVSVNPGHFASSMGAIELTVALHYVFDTPDDRIVWDVGHQAYPHKILTGRRHNFSENRKLNGLSGFPNPAESDYDTFTAGHASNSISAALGMAVASQLRGDNRHVVAVIGDAAIAGGLAFEGLNNAANTPNNLLIILNDNDMSIDRAQGSLNSYLAKLTASRGYNNLRHRAYSGLRRLRIISEKGRGALLRFNNSLKSFLTRQQNIFEGLNIRYFGPFNGHDVNRLIKVLNDIKRMQGPKILHLKTVKGYGYAPAVADPAIWHAPGRFDAATGQRISNQSKLKYQDVFGKTLTELARADKRIVSITAAMPTGTSVADMAREFPERTFDVGISEAHAVTFAGGLAKEGMKPFVAIYSSFLQRSFDSIIHDTAIASLPVVYCIDRAGLVGEDGPTHHGLFDLAYLSTVPSMQIAAPSSGQMLSDLMAIAAGNLSAPLAIRYPRGEADRLPEEMAYVAPSIGKAIPMLTPEKPDALIISIGNMLTPALKAAALLAEKGINPAVVDAVWLKPLDVDTLAALVGSSEIPVFTIEDGTIKGGLGSAVSSWLSTSGRHNRLTMIGIDDCFITQGSVEELRRLCGLDAESIADTVAKSLNKSAKE